MHFQIVNPLTPQRIVQFSLENLLLFVYGMAYGHKQIHTPRVHIDTFLNGLELGEKDNRSS